MLLYQKLATSSLPATAEATPLTRTPWRPLPTTPSPHRRPQSHNKHHLAENNTGARNNSSYIIYTAALYIEASQATVTLNNFASLTVTRPLTHTSAPSPIHVYLLSVSFAGFFFYFIEFFPRWKFSHSLHARECIYGTHKCISLPLLRRVGEQRLFPDILVVLEFQFHLKISNIIMHINRRLRPCFIFIECTVWQNSPYNRLLPLPLITILRSLRGEPKTL